MSRDQGHRGSTSTPGKASGIASDGGIAPGKRTLTEQLQRRAQPGAASPPENAENALSRASTAGGGTAPAYDVAAKVERATGADLSGVRIHTGAEAGEAAAAVDAKAYTIGQNVFFGAGQYQPGTPAGQELLAHELVHTVQQSGGAVRQNRSVTVSSPCDAAEQEADHVAAAALAQQPVGPIREHATGIARQPNSGAGNDAFPAERGFTRRTREVISNAPAGSEAWNGTYQWDSKMHLAIQPAQLTVTVRIFTSASEANRTQWAQAIADKWSGRMDLNVLRGVHTGRYQIIVGVQWVNRARDADYTVRPNAPTGPTAGGRMGIGGTTSMTDWGTGDTTDVTHEFGHMLGNPEEYFTTNGVDYTNRGTRRGFRDAGAGIMNNPADVPFERHYDTIRQNAAEMLGVPADGCVVEPHQQQQRQLGDFPITTNDGNQALA